MKLVVCKNAENFIFILLTHLRNSLVVCRKELAVAILACVADVIYEAYMGHNAIA